MLIEGTSIRSTERITGLHRDTILKLLVIAGENCEKVLRCLIVRVPVRDVQYDEVWGFVLKKEGHKEPAEANDNSVGDAYTFVAIERNTKLVLNLALGRREQLTTMLSSRVCGLRPPCNRSKSRLMVLAPTLLQSMPRFRPTRNTTNSQNHEG